MYGNFHPFKLDPIPNDSIMFRCLAMLVFTA